MFFIITQQKSIFLIQHLAIFDCEVNEFLMWAIAKDLKYSALNWVYDPLMYCDPHFKDQWLWPCVFLIFIIKMLVQFLLYKHILEIKIFIQMCKIYSLKNTLKQEIYICMYVREMYQQGNTKGKKMESRNQNLTIKIICSK